MKALIFTGILIKEGEPSAYTPQVELLKPAYSGRKAIYRIVDTDVQMSETGEIIAVVDTAAEPGLFFRKLDSENRAVTAYRLRDAAQIVLEF